MTVLHDHAGHTLTIGHPSYGQHRTVLWCDTCDELVREEATLIECDSDHAERKAPIREG